MDTYNGHVRTPADAIKLFEACRLGLLPRVQRRLSEKERQSIKSGSVFVWDEREAGMRRWTDGKSWSASRVSGSFLTYREMEGKRGGGQFAPAPSRRSQGKTPESGRGSDDDKDMDADGPDGYRYKPDGLMKQSFSITTSTGQHLHLISYFSRPQANSPELPQPTTDPALRHIVPAKGMYPESTVHESTTPAVTRTPMQPGPYMPAPHMQGGRGAPYPPYPGHNGYWPPSPAPTPPYYNAQWAPSGPPPPHYQPGSAHTSPYQHHQTSPQQRPSSSGQPTTYDRPPQDASLAPPVPRGMSSATAAQYARSPSPRMAQAQLLADQSAQIARRALQSSPKFEAHLTNSPPRSNILPMPPMSGPARTSTPPQQTATADDTPQSNGRVSPAGTPKLNGNSQNIPSISSLVHAQDSVSVMSDNKSNSSRAGSRAGSRSPKDEQRPKDIPHDKLNIMGEDRRAIQVLDRKFNF